MYLPASAFYRVDFWNGTTSSVPATNVQEALDGARQYAVDKFIEEWNRSVLKVAPWTCLPSDTATPSSGSVLCAVDQNEVVCAHPGCTGPYNCKERGLQE